MMGPGAVGWVRSLRSNHQTYKGYHTFGSLQLQVEGGTLGREPLEAEAVAVESAFTEREEAKPFSPDIESLAERVYQLLRKEIRLEHERGGGGRY